MRAPSRISISILANFLGRGWAGALSIAFVPLYVRFLGVEAYGLVGFHAALGAVFGFLDLGISATVTRELARLSAENESEGQVATTLRTVELVYWGLSIALGCTIWLLADSIASRWLNVNGLTTVEAARAIRLMGVAIALRFPFVLYTGALSGLDRQVQLNAIVVVTSTLRNVGAIIVLWRVAPRIEVFFQWQAAIALVETVLGAVFAWRALGLRHWLRASFSKGVVGRLSGFAIGMTGFGLANLILFQADKVLLSKILPLRALGYYSIGSAAVSGVTSFLFYPVLNALSPRMCRVVVEGQGEATSRFYQTFVQLLSLTTVPASIVLCVFSHELLMVWTRDPATAADVRWTLSILAVANLLVCLRGMPWVLLFANGNNRVPLYYSLAGAAVLVSSLMALTPRFGTLGAAAAGIPAALVPFLICLRATSSLLPAGELWRSVLRFQMIPILACLVCAVAVSAFCARFAVSPIVSLFAASALCTLAAVLVLDEPRRWLLARTARMTSMMRLRKG